MNKMGMQISKNEVYFETSPTLKNKNVPGECNVMLLQSSFFLQYSIWQNKTCFVERSILQIQRWL